MRKIDSRKIARACFSGGAVCVLALLALPQYWLLGIMAGFATGYLSYEFLDLIRAMPMTISKIRYNMALSGWEKEKFSPFMRKTQTAASWALRPRPFFYLALIVLAWYVSKISEFLGEVLYSSSNSLLLKEETLCLFIYFGLAIFAFTFWVTEVLACLGAGKVARRYWLPISWCHKEYDDYKSEWIIAERLKKKGLKPAELTYLSALLWFVLGACFLPFYVAFWIGVAIVLLLTVVWLFLFGLFKFVHSRKRLYCGFSATLGGVVAYFICRSPETTIVQLSVLTALGGLIAMALGLFLDRFCLWACGAIICKDHGSEVRS